MLAGLDEQQREAVTSPANPLAVLAPAGSGTTRVLTRRIAHRIATGEAEASHVLAVTFTRKAAVELRDRLRQLGLRDGITTGTFHALALALLRDHARDHGGRPPRVLDRKGPLLRELADKPTPSFRTLADVANEIAWSKSHQIPPALYREKAARRRPVIGADAFVELYRRYEVAKRERGYLDFDDLLLEAAQLLERDASFAASQRWRFRHLFVDEFQDVNPLQFRVLQAWRGDRYDLFVVGDPQQAIYGWNGADPSFLTEIRRHFPPIEVIQLVRNYRSSAQILSAASSVLRGAGQAPVDVEADRADGDTPGLLRHDNEIDEAAAIAAAIRRSVGPGQPWSAHAVLARTHAQLDVVREQLERAEVPCVVRGDAALVDEPSARAALAVMENDHRPLVAALDDLEATIDADDPDPALLALSARAREALTEDPALTARELVAAIRADAYRGDAVTAPNAVTLATFHAAKGLEWPVVHLAGLEEGFVPLGRARTQAARDEEARLLYVAMTRAERNLFLHWSASRRLPRGTVERQPSPLLGHLPEARPPEPVDHVPQLEASRARLAMRSPAGNDVVYNALLDWRERTAKRARTEPAAVLPDRILRAIADGHPTTEAALGEIPGVGPLRASRLGQELLDVLAQKTE